MSAFCRCCGRQRVLQADGTLPAHWNLGLAPCAGADRLPLGTDES